MANIENSDDLATSTAPADLPAGDARREALKAAYDELNKQAEQLAAELGIGRPDPKSFRRVRDESVRPMDADLLIKHPDKNYAYSWIFRDPRGTTANRAVHIMEAKGWEVVLGHMPEAKGMKVNAENAVWNADCVLMRIRKDARLIQDSKDWEKRRLREGASAETLRELADKYGVPLREEVPASVAPQVVAASNAAMQSRAAKRGFARQMATQKFDNALRTGSVPGMPIGR